MATNMDETNVRPAVKRFAISMEKLLRRHDSEKGASGWREINNKHLVERLEANLSELNQAIRTETHEEIMEGLERFIKEEPWHGEIKFCPHPSSWLNAGEWMNEYAEDSPTRDMGFDELREYGQKLLAKNGTVLKFKQEK